jgi:hypothetical protein
MCIDAVRGICRDGVVQATAGIQSM